MHVVGIAWEASGTDLGRFGGNIGIHVGAILRTCCRCCETVKLKPLTSETLVFELVGLPLWHNFRELFEVIFGAAVWMACVAHVSRYRLPKRCTFVTHLSRFC